MCLSQDAFNPSRFGWILSKHPLFAENGSVFSLFWLAVFVAHNSLPPPAGIYLTQISPPSEMARDQFVPAHFCIHPTKACPTRYCSRSNSLSRTLLQLFQIQSGNLPSLVSGFFPWSLTLSVPVLGTPSHISSSPLFLRC